MVTKKSKYRIDIGTTKSIYLKSLPNIIGGIATEIGWTLDDDGVPPAGRTIVAENRSDAVDKGMVPFVITYQKNKKNQSTTILVSPDKADTVAEDLIGKTYGGGQISKVRAPRRAKFTI
ncbi:hypothetical protein [Anabaena sp. PCC 7108]|uniref:hypothetical protein n=1 Tax=Anabaena sp. PCC 7108 TaxID=163908 RepID=UPI00035C57DC|nr:hypothetical protein [Anabaena sp. PCC 7108]